MAVGAEPEGERLRQCARVMDRKQRFMIVLRLRQIRPHMLVQPTNTFDIARRQTARELVGVLMHVSPT
jgi:hypothetical protein